MTPPCANGLEVHRLRGGQASLVLQVASTRLREGLEHLTPICCVGAPIGALAAARLGLLLLPAYEINLVDENQHRHLCITHALEHLVVAEARLEHVGDEEDHVRVLDGAAHGAHHALVELVLGLHHSGCIRKDNLPFWGICDAHDAVPGRRGLGRGDAQVLTEEVVHHGRLTHVGTAHDAHKARTVRLRQGLQDGTVILDRCHSDGRLGAGRAWRRQAGGAT
mmetsp:Transcript_14842/g.45334  ORF Transcript_14842/g.45334 Transcript_14842/m.45334 type:complete len:222 (+) Transcript_14842:845-1510(+)